MTTGASKRPRQGLGAAKHERLSFGLVENFGVGACPMETDSLGSRAGADAQLPNTVRLPKDHSMPLRRSSASIGCGSIGSAPFRPPLYFK